MGGRSLHLRLIAGAAVAILAALAIAWLAMTWLFQRHIERREADELRRSALVLVTGLRLEDGRPTLDRQPVDPRFAQPASGLYWQVVTPAGAVRSRSLWDQALTQAGSPPKDRWRASSRDGPFSQRLLIIERTVQPDATGAATVVQVATDEAALAGARREFGRELALFLAGLWAVLSLAAVAQVRLGLRPLAHLGAEVDRLRRSPATRLAPDHPREIEPLTRAINALADARQGDVDRARRRAADLAHSLKTPLAALAAQSRRARDEGAADAADGLDRAIAAVSATLETELARARAAAARQASTQSASDPVEVAERLIAVLERTDAGARVVFEVDAPSGVTLPVPEDVLMEMLGALLENAARHARRQVSVGLVPTEAEIVLCVDDDGSGLDDEQAAQAFVRGGRLDEAGAGHGLGLAIVRDLVEATEGVIRLERSPLGGLRVALAWPRR